MGTMVSPVKGRVSSEWSRSRRNPATGKRTSHAGIDIAAAVGTNVYAAFGGRVVEVRKDSYPGDRRLWRGLKSGNFIRVENDDGAFQWYGHLSTVRVSKNERIKQGQHIGDVGKTGRVTGAHLHFETWSNKLVSSHFNPRILFDRYDLAPGSTPKGTASAPAKPKPDKGKTYRSLRKGSKGADVGRVQRELRSEGYTKQIVDDDFGAQTDANIRDFQKRTGLVVDGIAGKITQKRLGI